MSQDIHVDDLGTRFLCSFVDQDGDPVPLTEATTLEATVRKPSGTLLEKELTALVAAEGTAYWESEDGDLDEEGKYETQGYAELTAWEGHSDVLEFTVHGNL